MFRFESSQWLYFLFLLPLLGFVIVWVQRRADARIKKAFGERLYPYLSASVSQKKRAWKLRLQLLSLALFILAAARPQFGEKIQEIKSQGVEMMLLFDVSESMLAEDLRPNRLTFAKNELMRLIDLLAGSRIGLVAFAGSAALVSPITTDSAALKSFIEGLSENSVSSQGTDFAKALTTAKEAFERGGQALDPLAKATRVVVIASDGEDQEEGAMVAADELTKVGIRIFTVAFGTEKGAPIPQRDANGYLKGYKKDSQGQIVNSATRGTVLKELATKGKGSFYFASFGGEVMKKIGEDINSLEKSEFESSLATQYDEKYQWFLFFAFLIAIIEFALGDRRKDFKLWKGRFEVPPL